MAHNGFHECVLSINKFDKSESAMKPSYLEDSMNSFFRSKIVLVLAIFVLPLLASCAPDANASILSPTLGEEEIVQRAIEEDIRLGLEPTPEPVVVTLADLSDEEITAGLPDNIAMALASADASAGESLVLAQGCTGCHLVEEDYEGAGPTWWNLGNTAIERATDSGSAGPAAYLYESISAPGDYLVSGYNNGVMPANYLELLSDDDFATLIAYILEQQQGS